MAEGGQRCGLAAASDSARARRHRAAPTRSYQLTEGAANLLLPPHSQPVDLEAKCPLPPAGDVARAATWNLEDIAADVSALEKHKRRCQAMTDGIVGSADRDELLHPFEPEMEEVLARCKSALLTINAKLKEQTLAYVRRGCHHTCCTPRATIVPALRRLGHAQVSATVRDRARVRIAAHTHTSAPASGPGGCAAGSYHAVLKFYRAAARPGAPAPAVSEFFEAWAKMLRDFAEAWAEEKRAEVRLAKERVQATKQRLAEQHLRRKVSAARRPRVRCVGARAR